jgi:hypothetical protein
MIYCARALSLLGRYHAYGLDIHERFRHGECNAVPAMFCAIKAATPCSRETENRMWFAHRSEN